MQYNFEVQTHIKEDEITKLKKEIERLQNICESYCNWKDQLEGMWQLEFELQKKKIERQKQEIARLRQMNRDSVFLIAPVRHDLENELTTLDSDENTVSDGLLSKY